MKPYRVTHRTNGDRFYIMAVSPTKAIESLMLHIGNNEGLSAWIARPDNAPIGLVAGLVIDGEGRQIRNWRE